MAIIPAFPMSSETSRIAKAGYFDGFRLRHALLEPIGMAALLCRPTTPVWVAFTLTLLVSDLDRLDDEPTASSLMRDVVIAYVECRGLFDCLEVLCLCFSNDDDFIKFCHASTTL
uniref:Cyclin_C domain-containing protein n=1 Tax=Panagrellus redivivus TaxID=6233 RepID=A0A7E4VYP1_PANRE